MSRIVTQYIALNYIGRHVGVIFTRGSGHRPTGGRLVRAETACAAALCAVCHAATACGGKSGQDEDQRLRGKIDCVSDAQCHLVARLVHSLSHAVRADE